MRITHINYRPGENFDAIVELIKSMPPLGIINACDQANVETPKSIGDLCFLKDKKGKYYLARYFDYKDPEPFIDLTGYTPPQEGWEDYD